MNEFEIIMTTVAFFATIILFLGINLYKLKEITSPKKKRKKKKNIEIMEVKYLIYKFNLKEEKLLNKKIIILFAFLNSLIITTVFVAIILLPYGMVWKILLSFILLMGFIYSVYGIVGTILLKRGYDK